MQTHEIRQRFLDHFIASGHTEVPSASLVLNDPNQLFVIAGMVPFVPYFKGEATPEYSRATSIQKCVRTLDIEEVGITTRHNTFFQMAGNFSFGDYFKKEAIRFAWDLLTGPVESGGYGIDPTLLWSTVYLDDDEAYDIWVNEVGQDPARIQRRGMKDNYWSTGAPGPAGPCSEIFYDRGPDYGVEGGPEADEDRYIEIWNLVFMQKERGAGTGKDSFEILGDLPKKNIDTGMGIERVAFLLQGVDNVYETDLLRPLIDLAVELTGTAYDAGNSEHDRLFRVIADHSRTAVMLIGDGVRPGNEGRGYVLRRLLRRIIRSAKLLGADGPTIERFVGNVISTMAPSYPELVEKAASITAVAVGEENAFGATLEAGTRRFADAAADPAVISSKQIAGSDAFALHDTYGFPIDLTLEMAAEAGLTVDEAGFRSLMAEQRQRAKDDAISRRSAGGIDPKLFTDLLAGPNASTEFTGFDELTTQAKVLGLIAAGARVPVATVGTEVEVILDRSPLYAESGGQTADIGTITTAAGAQVTVTDVQKVNKKLWRHVGIVSAGEIYDGDDVVVAVDPEHRHGSTQGHSGTHLVHAALRQILGPDAVQAGSLNKPGYLRFDFRWGGALSDAQRGEVEAVANAAVAANYAVNTIETDLNTAKKMGAMALFGENYGDDVRVVEMGGPFSIELCGGTHVGSTAGIGNITLLGEASVGSGIRRVEAYVGQDAYRHLATERALLSSVAATLKVPSGDVPARVESIVARLREVEKERDAARAQAAAASLATAEPEVIGNHRIIARELPAAAGELRSLIGQLLVKFGSEPGVVALFGRDGDKVPFLVAVNAAGQERGLAAGDLVKRIAPILGARGGGKADVAQGAGTETGQVEAAIAELRSVLLG